MRMKYKDREDTEVTVTMKSEKKKLTKMSEFINTYVIRTKPR